MAKAARRIPGCSGICSSSRRSPGPTRGRRRVPLTQTTDNETHPARLARRPARRRSSRIAIRPTTWTSLRWRSRRRASPSRCRSARARRERGPTPKPPATADRTLSHSRNRRPPRVTRVTRVRGDESSLSWAPDSERIAFYAVRDGVGSVWVAPSNRRRAKATSRQCARPAPGRAAATRVALGRRARVVAGWAHAARGGSARAAARLQRQSRCAASVRRRRSLRRRARFSCGACRRRCPSTKMAAC